MFYMLEIFPAKLPLFLSVVRIFWKLIHLSLIPLMEVLFHGGCSVGNRPSLSAYIKVFCFSAEVKFDTLTPISLIFRSGIR